MRRFFANRNILFFRSTGDGNCLFNSCSMLLGGTESLANLLRILSCIELHLNCDQYVEHPLFKDAHKRKSFSSSHFNSVFYASIPNSVFDKINKMWSNADCVRETAIQMLDSDTYASFLVVLALPSVVGAPLRLYTKVITDKRLMDLYNAVILPLTAAKESPEPLCIFWGSTKSSDELDHFVPLGSVNKVVFSFNEAEHGKDEKSEDPLDALLDIFIEIGSKRKHALLGKSSRREWLKQSEEEKEPKKISMPTFYSYGQDIF